MSGCAACCADPCVCGYTRVADQVGGDLMAGLQGVVDCVRDIPTAIGARRYEVALVFTRWSEGARGYGVEQLVHRHVVLPTPLVEGVEQVIANVQGVGQIESGGIVVREVSGRFSEDVLRGMRYPAGAPVEGDEDFFWEITYYRDGQPSDRRRFVNSGAPRFDGESLEWIVTLTRAQEDRARDGEVDG